MCIFRIHSLELSAMFVLAAMVGCNRGPSVSSEEARDTQAANTSSEMAAEVTAALATLSEDDRLAAEAQKFCAVEQESLLGAMGAPFKVTIEGQPVFLCCEGCKDAALKDPPATLAAATKLKEGNASTK